MVTKKDVENAGLLAVVAAAALAAANAAKVAADAAYDAEVAANADAANAAAWEKYVKLKLEYDNESN